MSAHRPIVVGVDGSAPALQAVIWGAREAKERGVPLALVTTVSIRGFHGTPGGMPAGFFEQEEGEGRKRLSEATDRAHRAASGLEVESHLCTGSPVLELIERSKTASMVVVGAGHSRLGWERFGSVSSSLVLHTHAPAVVVRDLPYIDVSDITGPVVLGVDGSEDNSRAVELAFDEAARRDVELVAVHAWSDVDVRSPFRFRIDWDAVETRERALLSENLAGYVEQFPDVPVRPIVAMDQPSHNLAAHAANAQWLVLGRRGRGGFPNMLLGSTTWALLHTVLCPLMVVP
nr:universal stress protein [Rhodococcus rhodochrous]